MKVIKFGGSSLADGEAFQQAINIITADPSRRIIVTSAPGKRFPGDVKVTDLLISYAQRVIDHQDYQDVLEQIIERYQAIADHFGIANEQLTTLIKKLTDLPKQSYPNNNYLLAAFKAHGERSNALLMTLLLQHLGYEARFVTPTEAGIRVTGTPNNARVIPETYSLLNQFANSQSESELLVFPGFYGITLAGHIATFSRGGSDITGAILARGLHADLYENFTDVDAIYSANPSVVDNPQPIAKMTYREMRELSYAGFSVFHDEALIPAIQDRKSVV